ncbi:ABC transporter ATP-binding protein [Mycobacterium montefiorense]|nr:ABC transporter ATP-binding protein [Mycobacterium montefiorense]
MRLLWSFAAPHRGALAAGLVLGLLGSAAGLATPMVTKWVLDSLGQNASLRGPAATLLGLFVLGAGIHCAQWILLGTVGERIVLDARTSMVRRFLRATVPAITSRPPGELITRVTSDTVLLHTATSTSLIGLINGAVMLVGTLVLMGVLDTALLAATLAVIAIAAVLSMLLMPGIAAALQEAQHHLGLMGGILEGALRAVRTLKASRAEERQATRIIVEAKASTRQAIHAVRWESIAWTIAWAGVDLAIVVIIGVGAWRVSDGTLALSSLIAFLLYAFGLIDPVVELSQDVINLQAGIAAASRIREVETLEVEPDPRAALPAPAAALGDQPVIEMRGVTAGYGTTTPAVCAIDLAIAPRGHIAIVGPSGAGKTTVLSLILRFLEPQVGELLLRGRPYSGCSHAEIRKRLAFVEQETPSVPGTIRENLLYTFPGATEDDLRRALRDVGLDDEVAAMKMGVDTDLTSSAISSGQRQRVALARSIMRPSDVLLLDEATAHVDALAETAIHDCIRRLARDQAVVSVAHRLSTVVDADAIVVMQDGNIRAQGTHTDLLATDQLYRDLVDALWVGEPSIGTHE